MPKAQCGHATVSGDIYIYMYVRKSDAYVTRFFTRRNDKLKVSSIDLILYISKEIQQSLAAIIHRKGCVA